MDGSHDPSRARARVRRRLLPVRAAAAGICAAALLGGCTNGADPPASQGDPVEVGAPRKADSELEADYQKVIRR